MIVSAAVKMVLNDYCGTEVCIPVHRHKDAVTIGQKLLGYKPYIAAEGFLTEDGTFLDRCEAFDHAAVCGQIDTDNPEGSFMFQMETLFSEDLW